MKYLASAVFLAALVLNGTAQSQEARLLRPGIFAGIDLGRTTVEFRSGPSFNENGDNKLRSFSAALSLGYQWSIGVILEARFRSTTSPVINLFGIDTEELSESQYLIGYRHFVNDRTAVVPMIGYSDWEVDEVSSGTFSSSGPSRVETESGNGTVLRLGIERHVGSAQAVFSLYTSYSNNTENRAHDTSLGFKFYF
jgi:hypothetical protein